MVKKYNQQYHKQEKHVTSNQEFFNIFGHGRMSDFVNLLFPEQPILSDTMV